MLYISRTAFKKAKETLFDETFLKFLPKYFEKNYNLDAKEVEEVKKKKYEERGGFYRRAIF